MKYVLSGLGLTLSLLISGSTFAYPLEGGYAYTGIGRIEAAQRIEKGTYKGKKQPSGGLLPLPKVDLRLLDYPQLELPAPDRAFTRQIRRLLGSNANRYGISVLDLSDPAHPRYAAYRDTVNYNPGSVGKLMVALGIFQALADIYPKDIEARKRILRESRIVADEFHNYDSHTVRIWDRKKEKLIRRPLRNGDDGSLWEYLDWMISPSSNAAAGMLTKHLMLLVQFGKDYPITREQADHFFAETSKKKLTALLNKALYTPVERNGLDLKRLRQGSFFTRIGKQKVPGTSSHACSRELMRYLLRMEQGRLVDIFSSREIKRLMYVTEKRIRYASAPTLRKSAVYFKSGSWYQCKAEAGFKCGKYKGNVRNLMNSTAIVESPAIDRKQYYLVTLMSNVLRRNSAVDHQTLATRIHRLIEKAHPVASDTK